MLGVGGGRDDGTDNSSCSSDHSKNTSSHRLMPPPGADISTVAGSLPVFQAPPSSLPDSTPTYWSATQLLTEHEQRALNLSYSAIHGPMETIREEYIGYPEEYGSEAAVEESETGITNPAFTRNNNGTPVHGVFGGLPKLLESSDSFRSGLYRAGDAAMYSPAGEAGMYSPGEAALYSPGPEGGDRHSAASSSGGGPSDSVISVGSNLYRGMVLPDEEAGPPVQRYSTGVQTTAPSTTASLRQNGAGVSRARNVSLV